MRLLLLIIPFSLPLYGMEITKKQKPSDRNQQCIVLHAHKYLKNKVYNSNNITQYSKLIDLAEQTKNGLLIAKLIKICLPPEITQTVIGQHLAQWVNKKYQQNLITYKCSNECFKQKTGCYLEAIEDFQTFFRHDGTYSVVPKIDNSYILWDEKKNWLKFSLDYENQQYSKELISTHCNKNGVPYSLAVLESDDETEQNKTFHFSGTNYADTHIFNKPIFHYLFSYDGTLLAMESEEGTEIVIRENTKTINGVRLLSTPMKGAITALCSAHKSRTFVAGSNGIYNPTLPNLVCITEEKNVDLDMHSNPITFIQFSPDDSRLLTCSYNKSYNNKLKEDYSHLCLWDTSNLNNITLIHTTTYDSKTKKAFFIDNGQTIMTLETNGAFHLFNGFTGNSLIQKNVYWNSNHPWQNKGEIPLVIWSNKNELIFTVFNSIMEIRSSKNAKPLGNIINFNGLIKGIGLTIDEKKIISLNKNKQMHQLELYDEQDDKEIAFIEQANIMQLYKMLILYKKSNHLKKTPKDKANNFIVSMQSYIQKHQQIVNKFLPK